MLSVPVTRTGSLRHLDDEVLFEIFELLLPEQQLQPLSLTCKWLRGACMPILFRTCVVNSDGFDQTENPRFLPRSLWPYVRVLIFYGAFARVDLIRLPKYHFNPRDWDRWRQDPARRAAIAQKLGLFAKEAFLAMPNLHTVRVGLPQENDWRNSLARAGIAAHVLEALLSTPHLRHFCAYGPMCNPDDKAVLEISLPALVPLESFSYIVWLLRSGHTRTSGIDQHAVRLLLERAHGSLVSLNIPSESTPLHCMHLWDWPRLTELRIYGERPLHQDTAPLAMTLGRMPRLRKLSLIFVEPAGSEHAPIWPLALTASYGWPDLEHLEVTHPHSDDEFYAHLPTSLRRLTLRCWPHYYKHRTQFKQRLDEIQVSWSSPLLASSEMLRLLRKAETPDLTHLELEFRAGAAGDSALFRHICSSYPRLTVLQMHCYRGEGGTELSVKEIAYALRGLTSLRLLRLHLDFQCLPDVTFLEHRSRSPKDVQRRGDELMQTALEAMALAANVFARTLAPSLEYVCFLLPQRKVLQQWRLYRVVRNDGECTAEDYRPRGWPRFVEGYDIDDDE